MPTLDEIKEQIRSIEEMRDTDYLSQMLWRKKFNSLPDILWEDEVLENVVKGSYNNGTGILCATTLVLTSLICGLNYRWHFRDIRALLNHNLFICEDEKKILKNANQYMRRRFAILKDSDILERLSAEYVQEKVAEHKLPIPIQVRCGKLVFPTENNDAKVVLQFLNEEIYQGALTGEYYETNSKRIYRRPKKIVR